ncbi:MAG TPA: hypothetical protein VKT77_11475 [Chthonomonadaceae bacterium]|nr:hypothetical protein [Chthonomonadaceae bacterium]
MLPLDDPRWKMYKGGYRCEFDASGPLQRLLNDGATEDLWSELWDELHHQGDVDAASYAAVPYLLESARRSPRLDWNAFALIFTIEIRRPRNPPIPDELADGYFRALDAIPAIVGAHPDRDWNELLTQSIVACIALARGQRLLAQAYSELDQEEAKAWLDARMGYEPDEDGEWQR